jgi:hypothetical protein
VNLQEDSDTKVVGLPVVNITRIVKGLQNLKVGAGFVEKSKRKAVVLRLLASALPGLVSLRSETVTLLAFYESFRQLSRTKRLEKSSLTSLTAE